jgi:hypothetical protein
MAGLLWGCQARPTPPPKNPAQKAVPDANAADKSDSLRFAEQLVDGLLSRTDDAASKGEVDEAEPAKATADGPADTGSPPPSKADAAASSGADPPEGKTENLNEDAPKSADENTAPSSPARACDDLCARGTACVAKLIDAQEKRVRRPSKAKKRLPDNELMCRDDCDDRMERAADRSVIAKQATKCAKAPDCEAFMRCVEEYFEDD